MDPEGIFFIVQKDFLTFQINMRHGSRGSLCYCSGRHETLLLIREENSICRQVGLKRHEPVPGDMGSSYNAASTALRHQYY